MRAIFMIPSKPPPSFSKPDRWSSAFIDFVSRCLVKNPEERATASELLQHEFIRSEESDFLCTPIAFVWKLYYLMPFPRFFQTWFRSSREAGGAH